MGEAAVAGKGIDLGPFGERAGKSDAVKIYSEHAERYQIRPQGRPGEPIVQLRYWPDSVGPNGTKDLAKVNDAVERFYEAKNRYRPSQPPLSTLSSATCSQATYPQDARMGELEGTTVLSYQVNSNGQAINAEVSRSSGWAILDEAALNALSACMFSAEAESAWQKKVIDLRLTKFFNVAVRFGSAAEVRDSRSDFSLQQHAMLARPSAIGQEQKLTELFLNRNNFSRNSTSVYTVAARQSYRIASSYIHMPWKSGARSFTTTKSEENLFTRFRRRRQLDCLPTASTSAS